MTAPTLTATGPLELLDGALLLVRRGGARALGQAMLAGAPLAILVLAIYYLERVEGVRSLRPLFAALLALAYLHRALRLSRVARGYALLLRPSLPVTLARARATDVFATAGVVGLGLWAWLWPMVALATLSPFAIAGFWPVLAVRGGVAPSWLARSACEEGRGLRAFGRAFDDTAGMRGVFSVVELLTLLGALGVFANIYALCSLGLLLARSLVGLDVALVSTFLSPDNTLVPLFVACATLLCMEPLRAALSAQAFVDARSRRDGADLHAAVDAVIDAASGPRRKVGPTSTAGPRTDKLPAGSAALLLCLAGAALLHGACPTLVGAAPNEPTADAPPLTARSGDARVREQVDEILARHEFREFADQSDRTISQLFERFFAWLDEWSKGDRRDRELEPSSMPAIPAWVLVVLALCGAGLVIAFLRNQQPQARPQQTPEAVSAREALLRQNPASFIDEAARLARAGDPRAALRALYVATLVALDRARLIEFDPARTNWQYLRDMPHNARREDFAAFTRLFDHKWYGHEATTMEDYARGRELADRVCDPQSSPPPALATRERAP